MWTFIVRCKEVKSLTNSSCIDSNRQPPAFFDIRGIYHKLETRPKTPKKDRRYPPDRKVKTNIWKDKERRIEKMKKAV